MSEQFDAIVVGGGFAGVSAARELAGQGRRTLLLEGKDRLGGKTWTDTFAGHQVEKGGTYVHWVHPHTWSEVMRYGLEIVEEDAVAQRFILAGENGGLESFPPAETFAKVSQIAATFFEGVRELLPRPFDPLFAGQAVRDADALSLRDRFDQVDLTAQETSWFDGFMSMEAGQPTREAGFLTLARWWACAGYTYPGFLEALGRFKVVGGTRALIEAMATDRPIDIRLSSPVSAVEDDGTTVTVTVRSGERFTAPAAVLALPVNVWPTIEISPGLSPARLEAARVGVNTPYGAKVLIHAQGVSEPFWAAAPEGYTIPILYSNVVNDDGSQLITGFTGEPSIDLSDRQQLIDGVRAVLPEAEVLDIWAHDWATDEFACGGWTVMKPGQLTKVLPELQLPQGRVAFASSDLASGWSSWMDGAIESGIRAARQVRGTS